MPAIPAIIAGGATIGGALINRKSARTQTQDTKQSSSGSVTPIESAEWSPLAKMLRDYAAKALGSESSLPAGFETGGIGDINSTWDSVKTGLSNTLTSRGLGSSPVAGAALTRADMGRAGDINRFRTTTLPSMEREWKMEDFRNALSLYGQRPVGQKTEGTTSGSGSVVFPGSVAGGAAGSFAEMLAYLAGKGSFGGGGSKGNTSSNGFWYN